jgi:hypothetical protein
MDALVRLDEARAMRTAKPCGPGLPTLRSSSQDGDVGSSGPTRRPCGRRWLSKPGHRGELGISRKPSRRECRLLRPCLWLLPPAYFVAGGPWVRPASGIPCALLLSRAAASCITRAFRAAGIFFHVFSVTMPRFMRGIQYPRDLSWIRLPPLEYWIARSSRAMTPKPCLAARRMG